MSIQSTLHDDHDSRLNARTALWTWLLLFFLTRSDTDSIHRETKLSLAFWTSIINFMHYILGSFEMVSLVEDKATL